MKVSRAEWRCIKVGTYMASLTGHLFLKFLAFGSAVSAVFSRPKNCYLLM